MTHALKIFVCFAVLYAGFRLALFLLALVAVVGFLLLESEDKRP